MDAEPLLRKAVGDALRRLRLRQGRTLMDVARAARISMPYLSEIERGRKEASSEVLRAVAGALELTVAELLVEAHALMTHAVVTAGAPVGSPASIRTLTSVRPGPAPRPGGGVMLLAA